LDATLRRVTLPDKTVLILADTVGFIQQLPYDLVAAFRATLDETRLATLLLLVVDASDTSQRQQHIHQVNQVLNDIGAADVPQIIVWLSAKSGAGIDLLYNVLIEQLSLEKVQCWVGVPVLAGDLRARLFAEAVVLQEKYRENGDSLIEIQMPAPYFDKLAKSDSRLEIIEE